MNHRPQIEQFESNTGALIFRLPLEVFAGYIAFAHLVLYQGTWTLVDVGSGFGRSFEDLEAGFEALRKTYDLNVHLDDVVRVIITHGHIDHFGGLMGVRKAAPRARIALHELTRPVLVNYDERVLITRSALDDFLQRAGVPVERREHLLEMYMMGKQAFEPIPVDVTLHDGDRIDDAIRVIHVPGHAPGLIMLQIGDVLLTADHILPETSVALAPESIMPYTGVGHYIESLEKACRVEGVRVALGCHEWPMHDYYGVASRTLKAAHEKVNRVLAQCDEPRTIYQIAGRIYDHLDGYGELLKIEQTGARIEYLNQRGKVMVDNLKALEQAHSPALRYRRV